MTVQLCPPLNANYEHAAINEIFFDKADLEKLETLIPREQPPLNIPDQSCTTNLFFGFFFDGTRNNYANDDPTKSQSNVARLYDCFPGRSVDGVLPKTTDWKYQPDRYKHFFRVYVPGVATPFKEIGEVVPASGGGAFGAGGNERIVWALIQAINNVNRYFFQQPLVKPAEALSIVTSLSLSRSARYAMDDKMSASDDHRRLSWEGPRVTFEKLLKRLHANVSQHWKKEGKPPAKIDPAIVDTIYISTFGFSRGATQARAFANWLQSLCRLDAMLRGDSGFSLGGFPVVFDFLGLFDTVASIGLGNTASNAMYLPTTYGHSAWADCEDSLRIGAAVKRCVHLVAGHELRMSFPLDSASVGPALPANCEETVFPGVHSDVGGGYSPREHGKGTDENGSDMLSRLPLLYMYKKARLAGVPLKLELADEAVKARFTTTQRTLGDFNAYLAACTKTSGSLTDIMREQAVTQMAWRYARRRSGPAPLHTIPSFKRATTFDQNDLDSANKDFESELRDFQGRGNKAPQRQQPGFQESYAREMEEIATHWPFHTPSPEVMHFFDEYVHDSRAGFKLTGQDNEPDALKQVQAWSRQLEIARQEYGSGLEGASAKGPPDYGMETHQREAAEGYDRIGKLPSYYTTGREFPHWGAGYFRFRKIFAGFDRTLLSDAHGTGAQTDTRTADAANEAEKPSTKAA